MENKITIETENDDLCPRNNRRAVRYIKQTNNNFTYGKLYTVIGRWGDFGDYVILDDNSNEVQTLKHFFEDAETA